VGDNDARRTLLEAAAQLPRQHIMPEASGTQITVTKKATVIKLDQQPPIENNDLQEEFIKAPGLLITEQHTPGQFNFSYRGLGNPQESEFITVLMDGVPLMSDWSVFRRCITCRSRNR